MPRFRALMVVSAIVVSACSTAPSAAAPAPTPAKAQVVKPSPPTAIARAAAVEGVGSPGVLAGAFGISDTSAYAGANLRQLSATPQVDGEFAARLSGEATYLGMRSPHDLARVSGLVVRGKFVSFSAPYWNSADGSFWATRYVSESAGTPVPNDLYRDVVFEVEEVLADATSGGVRPGPITFTTAGGQAVVTIPETVAALEPSFLPAGRFLWSSAPPVDAVVGEEAVLFLNYGTFYGLFDGKYAYQIKLLPANELYYKFAVDGENLKNAALHANATEGPFVLSLDELRKAVEGADLRGADKWHLSPDGGKVHAMPADHEHEPVVEPPDEQGGGPTPAPSDISREPTTP